jgi:hypothetical protein
MEDWIGKFEACGGQDRHVEALGSCTDGDAKAFSWVSAYASTRAAVFGPGPCTIGVWVIRLP